jgi:hypothetical protein
MKLLLILTYTHFTLAAWTVKEAGVEMQIKKNCKTNAADDIPDDIKLLVAAFIGLRGEDTVRDVLDRLVNVRKVAGEVSIK